jgi:hypothetical protein
LFGGEKGGAEESNHTCNKAGAVVEAKGLETMF